MEILFFGLALLWSGLFLISLVGTVVECVINRKNTNFVQAISILFVAIVFWCFYYYLIK